MRTAPRHEGSWKVMSSAPPRSCAFIDHAGPQCLAQPEPLLSQQLAPHPFLRVF